MARPRIGYGTKLGFSHVLLVALVGLFVAVLIDRSLDADLHADLDARLEAEARGASEWVREGRHPDRLAFRLAGIAACHVTILDGAGRVLGDSDPEAMLGADESRAPEVQAARGGKVGHDSRPSRGEAIRFVAVPVGPDLVLRMGSSLSTIEQTRSRVRGRLLIASTSGVALAMLLGWFASRLAARPLRQMRDTAHRLAEGDYDVRHPSDTPDEFGELGRSLSVLASRLSEDRTRIERLEKTRRDFVANVSHELRTPITAIRGYAETLLRGTADAEKTKHFLGTMHRQAERVAALVTDLLRLSELEAHGMEASRFVPVTLADVASEALATVREAHPEVRYSMSIVSDLAALGDAGAIEQILTNLVENGARYGKKSVEVAARNDGDRVLVTVSDDGPGIAAEHLPHVFERFYRVPEESSAGRRGTGLGLAIVKHLAESMNGAVRVESTVGEGTRFVVELPKA